VAIASAAFRVQPAKAHQYTELPRALPPRRACDRRAKSRYGPRSFESSAGTSGINNGATVILYGDNNNWFKSYEDLARLYDGEGVTRDKKVVAYCRIGERSSHSWFVLKYLLGYPNVKNYDGSWTEWGNLVGAPVER
jgi:thiosulfate/3-mercaptopyruvate sulfurtransferase